jgi:hypothetical protein
MKFKQRIPERWWCLIDVVKGPTPVYEWRDKQNLYGFKYKCEPPDIPVKLFANQHKLSCISSIHAIINQKITKTAIGPKFPYRR